MCARAPTGASLFTCGHQAASAACTLQLLASDLLSTASCMLSATLDTVAPTCSQAECRRVLLWPAGLLNLLHVQVRRGAGRSVERGAHRAAGGLQAHLDHRTPAEHREQVCALPACLPDMAPDVLAESYCPVSSALHLSFCSQRAGLGCAGDESPVHARWSAGGQVLAAEGSVHCRDGLDTQLLARGRHDPCVVPRAVPMVEAMVALVLADHLLQVNMSFWQLSGARGCHAQECAHTAST